MFKYWRGFTVPERDAELVLIRRVVQCADAIKTVEALDIERRVMVQAGGNWGYWPRQFSERFKAVYTFEPDGVCFACLTTNTASLGNVVRLQAALGDKPALIDLWRDHDTTGNQRIEGEGIYPTLRIDDLGLPVCDLIYLDVEGQEEKALRGAVHTLCRCKPVVIFEEAKSLDPDQRARAYLMAHGYRDISKIGTKDIVMRPY
jgi:FkbM family methyltransferase